MTPQNLNAAIDKLRGGRTADTQGVRGPLRRAQEISRATSPQAAREGKLDPVIGRDEEIRRTIQVLARRTKNNPVLIGEPGVGKTAIAEGPRAAHRQRRRARRHQGPAAAGARHGLADRRREISRRVRGAAEGRARRGQAGARATSSCSSTRCTRWSAPGKPKARWTPSNLLKPALARGELHCIGATTLDEYRKHVEKDAALERRFQPVFVGEPTRPGHHLDPARAQGEIRASPRRADHRRARSSPRRRCRNRYITDRFLPDKAIDLMDEAASRIRMEVESKPEEIENLDRRIIQLKIEREALKKEKDAASKDRLAKLEEELANLEQQSAELTQRWQAEKDKIAGEAKIKEQLDAARLELEQAQRSGDLAKAGELQYGRIPELEKQLAEAAGGDQGRDAARGSHRPGHRRAWSAAGPAFRSSG